MRKINKTLAIGMVIYSITVVWNRFYHMPVFLHGLCLGTSIAFELIGVYSMNHDISRLKNFKKGLFKGIKFGSAK